MNRKSKIAMVSFSIALSIVVGALLVRASYSSGKVAGCNAVFQAISTNSLIKTECSVKNGQLIVTLKDFIGNEQSYDVETSEALE